MSRILRPHPGPYPQELRDAVIRERAEGLPYLIVAIRYRISEETVRRWCQG